jgi:hypothetical protein
VLKLRVFVLSIGLCAALSACGGDSPTTPSSATGFSGQWSGTTFQGRPITFTVVSRRVTAVTFGYNYNGCSGTKAFSSLDVEIQDAPAQTPPPPAGIPPPIALFGSTLGPATDTNNISIIGWFESTTRARGTILLVDPTCGESLALWDAAKR